MSRGVKIVGCLLVAVAIAGLCLRLIVAAESGQPFVGLNVYRLPIGTWSTIAVVVLAAAIGVYGLVRRIFRRRR